MSGMLLKNATVLDYFPVALDAEARPPGRDRRSAHRRRPHHRAGRRARRPADGEEVIDLQGVTVMPGNINAHGHLYAGLAAGMPAAQRCRWKPSPTS